ncbi:hypothetical protein HDU96_004318 [Phlyctochytrium bullatum]|nr:hypothetical protein HDU96_004318 [Phlyctochytrium bullatum]
MDRSILAALVSLSHGQVPTKDALASIAAFLAELEKTVEAFRTQLVAALERAADADDRAATLKAFDAGFEDILAATSRHAAAVGTDYARLAAPILRKTSPKELRSNLPSTTFATSTPGLWIPPSASSSQEFGFVIKLKSQEAFADLPSFMHDAEAGGAKVRILATSGFEVRGSVTTSTESESSLEQLASFQDLAFDKLGVTYLSSDAGDLSRKDTYKATVYSEKPIPGVFWASLLSELQQQGFSIGNIVALSAGRAYELGLASSMAQVSLELVQKLMQLGKPFGVDVVIQHESIFRTRKRLVIFDMDSTLIQQEVIDELAREVGVVDQVSKITEAAMNGEIDFKESLRRRVKLLTGCSVSVLEKVRSRITFTPGARELCKALKRLGFKMAVISGMMSDMLAAC